MPEKDFKYSNPLVPLTGQARISIKRFQTPTRLIEDYYEATIVPSEIAAKNPNRVALLLINNGDATVYCSFNLEPSASAGFPLDAYGGAMSMIIEEDGEAVGKSVYGSVTAGTSAITVIETVLEDS